MQNIRRVHSKKQISNTISPDSILWGLDRALERIELNMAKTTEARIVLKLEFANERLAEINEMERLNKPDKALKAEAKRNKEIADIEAESTLLSVEKQEAVLSHLQKHIEVLKVVQSNAPEQAQSGLDNAIENSNKAITRLQERINNKKQ